MPPRGVEPRLPAGHLLAHTIEPGRPPLVLEGVLNTYCTRLVCALGWKGKLMDVQ
ncbi:hypothetical protein C8R44DRAFT_798282 [Mycena epipterygia]|nr:hypothetical protein C8R44DRAFT_798282 [Mycena epipterygia]